MCTVSVMMDYGLQRLQQWPVIVGVEPTPAKPVELGEFIRTLEDVLERAKEYDRVNNQPDCELDEKRAALKKIADEMGVAIRFPGEAP